MLKDIIKTHIAPLMKQRGFSKKGLTWNKETPNCVQVLNLQKSRFSSGDEEQFTINLGVFNPKVWELCWSKERPDFIEEIDCFPRTRIGGILSGFSNKSIDQWWTSNDTIRNEELGIEIEAIIKNRCLPFLDELLDEDNMNRFCENRVKMLTPIEKIYLAIMEYRNGNVHLSNIYLDEVRNISTEWSNRANQIHDRLD